MNIIWNRVNKQKEKFLQCKNKLENKKNIKKVLMNN